MCGKGGGQRPARQVPGRPGAEECRGGSGAAPVTSAPQGGGSFSKRFQCFSLPFVRCLCYKSMIVVSVTDKN